MKNLFIIIMSLRTTTLTGCIHQSTDNKTTNENSFKSITNLDSNQKNQCTKDTDCIWVSGISEKYSGCGCFNTNYYEKTYSWTCSDQFQTSRKKHVSNWCHQFSLLAGIIFHSSIHPIKQLYLFRHSHDTYQFIFNFCCPKREVNIFL